jgi:predicted aconitase
VSLQLTPAERAMLAGDEGGGAALAMRILVATAEMLGATRLIPIASAHIDGCLYHGDSGVLFAERLASSGANVRVPTTLNVGALDLLRPAVVRLDAATADMARRMATAYVQMGCMQTWTCAPYQAGHRPALGQDVAWGESNAVVFCNSVLGARTNRYGDFLDICAAITGRAPSMGLHLTENRRATILIDADSLPRAFVADDLAYPIIGAWLGRTVGAAVAAFEGLGSPSEDQLKALGAAAAASGAVGLFHVIGVTPEAATRADAFAGRPPQAILHLRMDELADVRTSLSSVILKDGDPIDAVAIGSPHLSAVELRALDRALGDACCSVPLYACTSRHSLADVQSEGVIDRLVARRVVIVADTCIVVTPILPEGKGVLVTNSGKFAHYTPANTGYDVVFANFMDCAASAVDGRLRICGLDPT